MQKRTAYIVITLVLLAVALGLGVFYFVYLKPSPGEKETVTDNLRKYFPFGRGADSSGERVTTPNENNTSTSTDSKAPQETPRVIKKLRKLSTTPSAGSFLFDTIVEISVAGKKEKKIITTARFIDQATGHVFETKADSAVVTKISNTTIPRLSEAHFVEGGDAVIVRYLNENDHIETYYGKLTALPKASSTESTLFRLDGQFLTTDIETLAVSPKGTSIFYVLPDGRGFTAKPNGSSRVEILAGPIREWLPSWGAANLLTLTTKPSVNTSGYSYTLGTGGGSLVKFLGGIRGLTTLMNPEGTLAAYSESIGTGILLSSLNIGTGKTTFTGVATLPEKCVWSKKTRSSMYCAVPRFVPRGEYPDDWYKGKVFFEDDIWNINAETGEKTLVADLLEENLEADIIELALNPSEQYLVVRNKKDGAVWLIDLQK